MTAEELLTKNPLLAVKIMTASLMGKPYKPDWFVIKSIETSSTRQEARVELEYNELFVPFKFRKGLDLPFVITVNKIDLSLLSTNRPIDLKVSSIYSNKTYSDLLREKYNHVNMVITDDDILEKFPRLNDTKIHASDRSVRWYGNADINIEFIVESISRYIKNNQIILDHTLDFGLDNLTYNLTVGINRSNFNFLPVALSESNVSIVENSMVPINNETDKVNTEIELSFDYPYSDKFKFLYNRRSFHRTFTDPVHIKAFGNLTMEDVLNKINEKLKSSIKLSELKPFTIPKTNLRGEEVLIEGRYMLSILDDSLAHLGDIWIELERDYVD